MRVTVVHNPDAGEGRHAGRDFQEILEGAGFQVWASAPPPELLVRRGRRLSLGIDRPFPPLHVDDDVVGHDIGSLDDHEQARFELELESGALKLLAANSQAGGGA